jgi:hypothetical protein
MAITVRELIFRLQTFDPDTEVVLNGSYEEPAYMAVAGAKTWQEGPLVYDEGEPDKWERGTYGDVASTDGSEDAEGSVGGTGGEKTNNHNE